MPRPLLQHGVDQLEAMFASAKANLKVLKQLEHELQFRHVPRALALLEQIQAAIPAAGSVPAPVATGTTPVKQPDLWPDPSAVQSTTPPPTPAQRPPVQPATPILCSAIAVTSKTALSMTLDDAYKILKVSPTSPWQEVEQARKRLVQLSHPDRVAPMTSELRNQVRAEAQQVNRAYAVLSVSKMR